MFEISINSNKAWVLHRETLTRAGKNYDAQKVHLEFGDEWENLSKIAVFRALNLQLDVAVTGETIDIPPAVLEKAGVNLCLGLYGVASGGALVIPTIWADLGTIQPGADPWAADNYEAPPELLYSQIEAMARAAAEAYIAAAEGVVVGTVDSYIDGNGHLILSLTQDGATSEHDLGAVTAYAQAVDGGYFTGSFDAFMQLLTANAQTEQEVQAALDAVAGIRQLALDAHDDAADALDTAGAAEDTADEAKGIAQAAQTAVAGKQAQHKKISVVLSAGQDSWEVSAAGVTATNTVLYGPAPGDLEAAGEALVKMTAQGADTATFSAASVTTKAITMNLVILD